MTESAKTKVSLVDDQLTAYCESATTNEPEICRFIRESAALEPKAHWIAGPIVGTLLQICVAVVNAKRVLDIGTYLGYSAAYMATAHCRPKVVSLERDAEFASRARRLLDRDPVGSQIHIVNCTEQDWIKAHRSEKFDVVFFDSNRTNLMKGYTELTSIVKEGGLLVMDNACLHRKVLNPNRPWEEDTIQFNSRIQKDESFLTTLLPVRDGVLISYRPPRG
jgi:caffeoyl-CoA O-methyltransferase